MADWSPSSELQEGIGRIATRAGEDAVRERDRYIKDGDEALAGRGLRGGANTRLRRLAAEQAVQSFSARLIDQGLGLVESVYGRVPPESASWVEGWVSERIQKFAASIGHSLAKSYEKDSLPEGLTRRGHEVVNRAALVAVNDLRIRLDPVRIRAAEGISMERVPGHQTTVYNVTGQNARVNIHSTDASTNVVNIDAKQLFAEMRRAVDDAVTGTVIDGEVAGSLVERIDAMEGAVSDPKSFGQKYADFIQVAANHMAVFQPFLQGLAQLLGS